MGERRVKLAAQLLRQRLVVVAVLQTLQQGCLVEHLLATFDVELADLVAGHARRNACCDHRPGAGATDEIEVVGEHQIGFAELGA